VLDRDAGGVITSARAAACGVATRPVDISEAFGPAVGERTIGTVTRNAVVAAARAALAGDDDKAGLAGLLAGRALAEAAA
jgi:hypothetical protein